MAYTPATLQLMMGPIGGTGPQLWTYTNTDAVTDIDPAGYISDGGFRGMRVGDVVLYYDTDTLVHHMLRVETVNTTTGAVNLGLGVAVTSATTGD